MVSTFLKYLRCYLTMYPNKYFYCFTLLIFFCFYWHIILLQVIYFQASLCRWTIGTSNKFGFCLSFELLNRTNELGWLATTLMKTLMFPFNVVFVFKYSYFLTKCVLHFEMYWNYSNSKKRQRLLYTSDMKFS